MQFPIAAFLVLIILPSITSFRFPGVRSSRISGGRIRPLLAIWCDNVTTSIGIKIALCDLIPQINETNFEQIKTMLEDGFLEGANDDSYTYIFCGTLPKKYLEYKTYIHEKLVNEGLYTQALLYPIKEIIGTTRCRWPDRDETNGLSRALDFDLTVGTDEYKEIEKHTIVFMLRHHSYWGLS